jgi:DNA-binding transcriptional MerR regulator
VAVAARRTAEAPQKAAPERERGGSRPRKALTIGAVCKILSQEFEDISISKIRYLEDQKLLSPRRTPGGYRLYSQADVERLRTILRMQRDEFLPLRVIRQELSTTSAKERKRKRAAALSDREDDFDLDELCERAGISGDLARELEEFGLLAPRTEARQKRYSETDAGIAIACGRLADYGISARHLRTFRTAADREASLLEAVVAPALRARNAERRQEGLRELEALAEAAQELAQLLFLRDLREFAAR